MIAVNLGDHAVGFGTICYPTPICSGDTWKKPAKIDMKRKTSPSPVALLGALLIGGLGTWAGYLLGNAELGHPAVGGWFGRIVAVLTPWDLLAVPVLLVVVLGVHELGHLIAGLSQGMRFLLLIFGPFQWYATASGIRFRWVTRLGLMGGLAATMPTSLGPRLSRQITVMAAGGPIASLLLSVVAALLVSTPETRLAAWSAFVAASSFGVFIVTLSPMRAAGYLSDGMQILEMQRGGEAVVERTMLLQVVGQSLAGIRPRDWEHSTIERLAAADLAEPTRRIAAWLLLLYRASDRRDAAAVEHYCTVLARDIEEYPDGLRQSVHVELAICAALAGQQVTARHHLSCARGGIVEDCRRLLAQAVLAWLEGRAIDATDYLGQARKALARATDEGLASLTRDQLDEITSKQHLEPRNRPD